MKKSWYLAVFILLVSCNVKNTNVDEADSVSNSASSSASEQTADGLFAVFFEIFMWDAAFQKTRVDFPITIGGKIVKDSSRWRHLPFFSNKEYYPVLSADSSTIFDKDVTSSKIGLFVVNFDDQRGVKYSFEKRNGCWFLVEASNLPICEAPDKEFIGFLTQFSADSVFQKQHVKFPLEKLYCDSERVYKTVRTTIDENRWEHDLATSVLQDLVLLDDINPSRMFRSIFFRGVENGICVKYLFEKINGRWMLVRLEDYST